MTNRSTNREFLPSVEQRADDLMALSDIVNQFIDVPRATMKNGRYETDGEHTLHLQFIAVSYAAKYHPELDAGKVAVYALVHDFVEVYAQDVNSLIASSEALASKALTEKLAFDRLQRELKEAWPELIAMISAYESLEDREARFVKCFDKCDPSFKHYADGGKALLKMGVISHAQLVEMAANVRERMKGYAEEFPDILSLREELVHRVANRTYGNTV